MAEAVWLNGVLKVILTGIGGWLLYFCMKL